MSTELAKTGIDVIGAVPWGTHFCQFYQTKQDLLDTLVPYFKTGLENNEFCMWITAEPLGAQEARKAMRQAMPDFADRLSRGQIEILPHTKWYLKDGSFDQQRVLNGWVDKLNAALAAGYAGLRLTGNTFWLEKRDWKSFTDYEAAVNDVIGKYHMLALCTYSLDKCGATEVMDVIRNHEFALIRKEGKWELIENAVYKQAKQALLESEKKYRRLMENLHEGVGVVDKDLHLTFVNPHMAKVLGYTTDEILGEPVFKFIDESKWSATKQLMEQRLQGISENVEIELRRKDGSLLPVLISATPLTDDHGDFSGFVAGFADITERKQTEESVRRAKEEWERTFDSVPDLIAILDDQHRIVRVNKAMAARLACAPEQCVGLHCYKAVHGTDAPPAFCPHTKTITDQREHIEEVREDRLEGDFLVSTNPILDSQGRLIGSVHVARDITERKRREEKILKLTRLYAVLSRASEAIVRIGDANSLCSEICRIVAEEGGFPLVWIGQVEEQHVVPSAWSGPAVGYLKELKVEVQGELGRGPTGTCIRENRAVVNNDFATNTTVSPWREVALSYSFRASAAFPLRREGKAIGALSLYSFEANAFDADQVRLLESLGSDVSYALDSIGQEKRRIQAEETLRESEERLNRAQDIAHIGSWELDLLNNRLTWSDEAYRIFGLQPQEFGATYEAFLEAVHPDDRAAVNAAYSGSIREGRDTYEIEHRIVRRSNGQVRIVHERCEHMRDPSGRIIRSVGMVHDITERKQAEESLRETHDYLDSLLNYANAPIIVWDRDFRITRFNRAFQRLTGYRENEVLGKELHILFPEQTREESLAHIDRAVAGERWEVIEIPIQRADGVVRTILWNSANIRASDGETTVATIAQGQDITERKQAEDALRETRDYLDNLLNYANAPIIVWDPELRITKFNRAFQKLTGYAEAEVVGKRLDILFPEQSREESLVHISRAVAGERWEVIEIPIRRVDGTVRTVLWNSANILASDGKATVATIAQGQDITERKQAEEVVLALNETLRQRALQLEATNKELEAFAYSVSHDLRAPLRSIDGFSMALLEDYANKLDDQGKDCLQRVRAASQLMGELIDDMLSLSRVSRAEIHWKKVDLSGLAQKIAQELQDSEPKRRVKFIIAPDLLVYGDGPLLRAALENLLSNAWKFTGKRDRPKIEFGARKENGLQVYFVKDNGVGFDMSYVSKIFEPFQRLHSKNEFPGTGIGLATVRRIIDRHGGRVWAEGKVGDGATFYFTLSDHSERERR